MFELMIIPFCATVVLTGIFAYFGIHIIKRQVIFVDLALAQIAALGAIVGILFGTTLHSTNAYLFSLPFVLVGAAIFSLTRLRNSVVPQEAVIGIVYIVATAASIIVLNSSPAEGEHIKHMLVGNILFVSWSEIIRLVIACSIIGLFHFAFRKRFMEMSAGVEKSGLKKSTVMWWDFFFYLSLGLIVTASVEMAGVLLIFSYLVIPASCAMLLAKNFGSQILLGWFFGISASTAGLFFSAVFDLPTGAAIVCTFGGLFAIVLLAGVFRPIRKLSK